ncbi:hypothetical protein M430DRAFT_165905 [Amorphotheca resinae ATCC 22711]|uniref:Uncharacterized protein n=1 Tax=Amorphotheca resinae ATCC 22711 TaxID=857342 RepID=A0A2T3BG12_AMORE|nr:hypothetical protein M430DRAFT_165905 [Amorphotheca resinae ATCC 22711]PSS28331.1 hypothetical protein M430DRAFT_165905 [Amorphotheca resinae ATCC 22711]
MASSLAATASIPSSHACALITASGACLEAPKWNGSDITTHPRNTGLDSTGDNRNASGDCNYVYCSLTEPETKTERESVRTRTETAKVPKETGSKLAHLGLCIALLGLVSVAV